MLNFGKNQSNMYLITKTKINTILLTGLIFITSGCSFQTNLSTTFPTPSKQVIQSVTPTTISQNIPEPETPTPLEVNPSSTITPIASLRFAVIGDFGSGDNHEKSVADLVNSWHPDFIVTTGDNNYPSGSEDTIDENIGKFYHEYIFPYKGNYGKGSDINRFFPTLGNHDWMSEAAQPYLDYFTLPGNERYYEFTWGEIQFLMLDSDSNEPDGVGSSSIQAQWLKESLQNSNKKWQIVIMHHPPYTSGLRGPVDWMRWPYKDWGADAVLSGHDHYYERLNENDLIYFINGAGGGSLYDFGIPAEGSQKRFTGVHGAMLVTTADQSILFQFFTVDGKLIDQYTIYNHP